MRNNLRLQIKVILPRDYDAHRYSGSKAVIRALSQSDNGISIAQSLCTETMKSANDVTYAVFPRY